MATEKSGQCAAVEHYLSDFTALAENDSSGSPEWLGEIRRIAIDRFAEVGFPSSRDEKWRFTNFSRLVEKTFAVGNGQARQASPMTLEEDPLGWWSAIRVVFVDGEFSPELSSLAGLPGGAFVGNVAAAMSSEPAFLERNIARIADSSDNPFTALNTAFFSEGGVLYVPDGVSVAEPIQFLYLARNVSGETVIHPRNVVVVGESAEATIVESYSGLGDECSWTNPVTEVVLGDDAHLTAHRIQLESKNTLHTATTQCRQGRDSSFTFSTVEFGGSLSRHDINVQLNGTGASCALHGLSHLRDTQHVDNQTTIDHVRPHCSSVENFNGIFDEGSHGVFTGRVQVRPGAQQTDARQASRSLLLTDTARADAQPQLEIFADDVKCTHGATVGPIDEEALFYLRSKGLTMEDARTMLTYGFAVEIIDTIAVAGLREQLHALLGVRLQGEPRDTPGAM
jgi:Fe-S cluster assembly protein SufD